MRSVALIRILLLPVGLLTKLSELALTGSRDLHNKLRFKDVIVDKGCSINPATKIEGNSHVLENCLILNSTIRQFSYVGRNSIVQNASIGSYCSIANDVFIGLGLHPSEHFSTSPLFYRVSNTFRYRFIKKDIDFVEYQPIEIGSDVWIGARATILDGVKVGHGAIIATNAVVTKDVPSYAIVGGVPAKIIRYRFTAEKIKKLLSTQWWTWSLYEIHSRMKELNEL